MTHVAHFQLNDSTKMQREILNDRCPSTMQNSLFGAVCTKSVDEAFLFEDEDDQPITANQECYSDMIT